MVVLVVVDKPAVIMGIVAVLVVVVVVLEALLLLLSLALVVVISTNWQVEARVFVSMLGSDGI